MGQASRSGLRDVAGLFGVDTFNRRYECCDHCNRQDDGKDCHSGTVAFPVVVHDKPPTPTNNVGWLGWFPNPVAPKANPAGTADRVQQKR